MNEGNLLLPKRKSHRSVVSTLANRDIPLLNKKKWMLKYNKMLYNVIHPALKEWKKIQKSINKCKDDFLYSFKMAYKRRRTSRKGKCSKKKSSPFTISLNSRKRKGITTNSQVQKRLELLLQKRGKVGKSQQEGFIGTILAATAPLWLPLAVKGVKKILH